MHQRQINKLQAALSEHLSWHGARIKSLALFLVALFRVRTVNQTELAGAFASRTQTASNQKRLKRFFSKFEVDEEESARVLVGLAGIPEPWTLSLDRTNWSFGSVHFNILVLGVLHEGIAFPLLWTMLDKQGNSNSDERMDLLDRFERLFGQVRVNCLTADREFIGQDWFSYLLLSRLPFRIRIRYNQLISSQTGKSRWKGDDLFRSLAPGQVKILSKKRWVLKRKLHVVASGLDDGELLILVTDSRPQTALRDYARRWGIETFFGALKTRGFNLEATHFRDSYKLSKLFALLAIAFTWAMRAGLWLHERKPLQLKSHGRRKKSLFRLGLDFLRRLCLDLTLRRPDFRHALQLLSLY
ncbi:MAG: IS4 family transposase [Geitlerinemataceae cyanobacterium]